MKGLIIKDLINLKKNLKIMGGLSVFYGFMSFYSGDPSNFNAMFTMVFAILTISIFSYDDLAKWDVFAQTLPISKDNIVQSKYLMMLLLTLSGSVVSLFFTILINLALDKETSIVSIQGIGFGASIVILFYCIVIPFIIKLGVEKARLIFFAVYMIPFVIISWISKKIERGEFIIPKNIARIGSYFIDNLAFLLPLVLLIALSISYVISRNIYRKKEF